MYNSGDAAEQVVRISLEGTEVALKLTSSAAKNIAAMLYAVWKNRDKNKTKGHQRLSAIRLEVDFCNRALFFLRSFKHLQSPYYILLFIFSLEYDYTIPPNSQNNSY